MALILDASAALDAVLSRLSEQDMTAVTSTVFVAPALFDIETGAKCAALRQGRHLSSDSAADAWQWCRSLVSIDDEEVLHAAWKLSDRFSFRDSIYVALADRGELWTTDRRMGRTHNAPCTIRVLDVVR